MSALNISTSIATRCIIYISTVLLHSLSKFLPFQLLAFILRHTDTVLCLLFHDHFFIAHYIHISQWNISQWLRAVVRYIYIDYTLALSVVSTRNVKDNMH